MLSVRFYSTIGEEVFKYETDAILDTLQHYRIGSGIVTLLKVLQEQFITNFLNLNLHDLNDLVN